MARVPNYQKNITTRLAAAGVIEVTIKTSAYPMVGEHWRSQLTGRNARKWGWIAIDPDKAERAKRRKVALEAFQGLYEGEVGNNNDECPGAMFMWQSNHVAHVQPCDARSNQDLGRDLYFALRKAIPGEMGWWQVRFKFAD
jgi:hypothetical protein